MRKTMTLLNVGLVIAVVAVGSGWSLAWAENCPDSPDALGTKGIPKGRSYGRRGGFAPG